MSEGITGAGEVRRDQAEPLIEGGGIKRVRLGSEDGEMPQGVFGLEAISRQTVGSEGIFMARCRVPPGAHSDLHSHANCETAVYVLRGHAYYGEDMGGYVEAGPGDFVHIPAELAHVVGCPAGSEPLEYVVARNAPEEVVVTLVVTLREAAELPIGPDCAAPERRARRPHLMRRMRRKGLPGEREVDRFASEAMTGLAC